MSLTSYSTFLFTLVKFHFFFSHHPVILFLYDEENDGKNCDENKNIKIKKNISSLYKTSICPNDAEQLLFYFLENKRKKKHFS